MFQNDRQWTPLEKRARVAAESRLTTPALGISVAESFFFFKDSPTSAEQAKNQKNEYGNIGILPRNEFYEKYNFDCEKDDLLYIRGWISSGELPDAFEIDQSRYLIVTSRKTFRPDVNAHVGMASSATRLGFEAVVKAAGGKSRSGFFFQERNMKMGASTSIQFTIKAVFVKQAPRGTTGHVDLMKKVTKFSVFS
jgi:hypothetical protein